MIWKTTNHKGEQVTWYSEDEVDDTISEGTAWQSEALTYRHVMWKIKHYVKQLQKANHWWQKAYRAILIFQILTIINTTEDDYGSYESNSN